APRSCSRSRRSRFHKQARQRLAPHPHGRTPALRETRQPPRSPGPDAATQPESALPPQPAPEPPSSATSRATDNARREHSIPPLSKDAPPGRRTLPDEFRAATPPVSATRSSAEYWPRPA